MILKTSIDKPCGMLLMEEDTPHRGGGACWTPFKDMVSWRFKNECEFVDAPRSEDHRKVEAAAEVKKERHCSSIVN